VSHLYTIYTLWDYRFIPKAKHIQEHHFGASKSFLAQTYIICAWHWRHWARGKLCEQTSIFLYLKNLKLKRSGATKFSVACYDYALSDSHHLSIVVILVIFLYRKNYELVVFCLFSYSSISPLRTYNSVIRRTGHSPFRLVWSSNIVQFDGTFNIVWQHFLIEKVWCISPKYIFNAFQNNIAVDYRTTNFASRQAWKQIGCGLT
jgi:hypothetical protein